jgi:hypothetical protein
MHFAVRIREARAPIVTVVPTSSKSNMSFTWTDPDGFATGDPKYYYAFDASSTTEPGPGSASTNNTQRNEFNVPDGLHYFHVRSRDPHGNLSPTAHYAVIVGEALVGLSAPSEVITRTGPVSYLVTYPGATSVSLTAADVSLVTTGTATGTVSVQSTADAVVKDIVISGITGDGTIAIQIASGTASVGGIPAPAFGPSASFTVDNTPPEIAVSAPSVAATRQGPVTYTVTYSGASDILLSRSEIGVVSSPAGAIGLDVALSGSGNTRTVTLSNIFGDGTVQLEIAAGTAQDAAGNECGAVTSGSFIVDNTPPAITMGLPSQILTRTGPVEYAVTYGGADSISLTAANVILESDPVGAVSGTTSIQTTGTNTRTLRINSISGDGRVRARIAVGTASDNAGNTADGIIGAWVTVDNTPPTISVSAPSVSATNTGPIVYTVTYGGADSVSLVAANVTLQKTGSANGNLDLTGSGNDRTVTISGVTGDGTLGIAIAAGTASDLAGNTAPAATGMTVTVDNTPPVVSIGAPSRTHTNTASVDYTVTITGATNPSLEVTNLTQQTTGTASGTFAVTNLNATQWRVRVNNPAGDGTLGFRVNAGTAQDAVGNASIAVTAQTFVVDNTPPGISLGAPSDDYAQHGPVTYTVSYTGASSVTLAAGNVTLVSDPPGGVTGDIAVSGSGTSARTITLTNLQGDGTVHVSVAAGTAVDLAGNAAPAATGATFVVDNTPPSITVSAPSVSVTNTGPIVYTVTYGGADSVSLAAANVTLQKTGTANGNLALTGSGNNYTATISSVTGDGTLGITIAAGTASDLAGNTAPAATGATVTVDNTPPVVSISAPSRTHTNTVAVDYTVTITGATNPSLTLANLTQQTTGSATGALAVTNLNATQWRVRVNNPAGDGTLGFRVNAGTAQDAVGNASIAVTAQTFVVDNTPPGISLGAPSDDYAQHGPVTYAVSYTGSSSVTLAAGNVTLVSDPPGGVTGDIAVSGSGTSARTITLSNLQGDGTVHVAVAAGTAVDQAGNTTAAATGATFVVDNTPPSITVSAPSVSATNTGPVTWTITYTGTDIVSLSAADITLAATGTAAGNLTLGGNGLTQRTITVSNTTGDGNLQPQFAAGTASDFAGNVALAASGAAVIIDNTPPTMTIGPPSPAATNTGPVTYTVTYEGANTIHLSSAMITPVAPGGGVSVGYVAVDLISATQRTITLDNISGDGALYIEVAAGSGYDLVGNATPGQFAEPLQVDNMPPGLTIGASSPAVTKSGPVTFTLTYVDAAAISLTPANITLLSEPAGAVSGTVTIEGTGTETRTLRLTNLTGEGSLRVAVAPGTANDAVGNAAPGAESEPVTVDKTPPAITISAPSASSSSGETVTYTVTYMGAEVITLRPEDITLSTTGDATGAVEVTGSGALSRTVSIVNPSGYGTIGFSIAAGTARDVAGNLAPEAGPSETFSVAYYTLRMQVQGWGTTIPDAGVHVYAPGEITLTALALEGAEFLGWEIDGVIHTETPHTFTLNRNLLVTARFTVPMHAGDQNYDYRINLQELLRVIQFYNSGGFGCQDGTEDGYAPNAQDRECTPHSSDYMPHDWQINLQELLRLIQFYNSGGYHHCPENSTEDGFCPGPPTGS